MGVGVMAAVKGRMDVYGKTTFVTAFRQFREGEWM